MMMSVLSPAAEGDQQGCDLPNVTNAHSRPVRPWTATEEEEEALI